MPKFITSLVLFAALAVFGMVPTEAQARDKFRLKEVTFGSGYAFHKLKFLGDLDPTGFDLVREEDDLSIVPFFVNFGYDMNHVIGLDNHRGNLLLGLEPFVNFIHEPRENVEAGIGVFLKYDYPIAEKLSVYMEAGIAPMYFGLETKLQGEGGFTFLDQAGGGIKMHFAEEKSFNVGYRFRHISSAGLREPNKAINGHAVIASVSKYF